MSQISAELVPFRDSTQLVLPASGMDIVTSGEPVVPSSVYLSTDIIQGQYGQAAFGLVVPKPERGRPRYFIAEEGPAGTYDDFRDEEREYATPYEAGTLGYAHYFDTMQGFIMLRTVALPASLSSALTKDKHLGPAILDKSCLEGVIDPKDFDEEYGLGISDCIGSTTYDLDLTPMEERLMDRLAQVHGEDYRISRQYASWHSYRAYAQTVEAVTQASRATVDNLNKVFGLLLQPPVLTVFDGGEEIKVPKPVELSPVRP